MITLEDQIRRYATDVAGPAVADPPADLLDIDRPHHRGRWVLVAALVVFIAGLTWVATRPAELGDQPTVDTVPSSLPRLSSWPEASAWCAITSASRGLPAPGEVEGVQLGGPNGDGLCVGVDPARPDQVWAVADGSAVAQATVNICTFIGGNGGGVSTAVGARDLFLVSVDPDVESVGFTGPGNLTAQAFDLPGLDRRVAAIWLPGGDQHVPVSFLSEVGIPVSEPPETIVSIPADGCALTGP